MLPDKFADPQVIWNGFIIPIHILIASVDGFAWNVVNEGSSVLWDFILENECHIHLVNLHHISITHWNGYEMMRSERTVEGGEIPRLLSKWSLIKSSSQV